MKAPSNNNKNKNNIHHNKSNGTHQPDDQEDKKLPAADSKEIQSGETSSMASSSLTTREDDTMSRETSLASMPSSWMSPVARAVCNEKVTDKDERVARTQATTTPFRKTNMFATEDDVYNKSDIPQMTAATPSTPKFYKEKSTIQSKQIRNSKDNTNFQNAIQSLQQHIYWWMATTLVAFLVILYEILPTTVLTVLAFLMASTALLVHSILYTAQQWYFDNVVLGPGLGPYLPTSLYKTLTQTTLHEFMTDPTAMIENRHLLLYFLPLSPLQLQSSILRLAPQHQERLMRPGLFHLLPAANDIHRLLFGDRQSQEEQQQQQNENTTVHITHIPVASPNGNIDFMSYPMQQQRSLLTQDNHRNINNDEDEDDDASDLGLNISSHDMVGGCENEEQAQRFARRFGLQNEMNIDNSGTQFATRNETLHDTNSPTIQPNTSANTTSGNDSLNEQDADRELQVLMDAMWNSYYNIVWNPMREYISDEIVTPSMTRISRLGSRMMMFLALGSGGLGLWGWWTRGVGVNTLFFHPTISWIPSFLRVGQQQQHRANLNGNSSHSISGMIWTTTTATAILLVGGATVFGVSTLFVPNKKYSSVFRRHCKDETENRKKM